jgi:hypothetical protein
MGQIAIFIVVFIAAAAVIAFAFIWSHRQQAARVEAMRKAAAELGLSFDAEPAAMCSKLGGLWLMQQGHSAKLTSAISGERSGATYHVFDYRYTTGSGKSARTWNQTVLAWHLPGRALTRFQLRPEGFWHAIGAFLGMQDIDFASHPAFSRAYVLKGDNEKAIEQLFEPHVLDQLARDTGWSVECTGDWMLIYRHGKRIDGAEVTAEEIEKFIDATWRVCEVFGPGRARV